MCSEMERCHFNKAPEGRLPGWCHRVGALRGLCGFPSPPALVGLWGTHRPHLLVHRVPGTHDCDCSATHVAHSEQTQGLLSTGPPSAVEPLQ